MAAVTVSRSGDRLVAVKRVGADGAEYLRREAQLLQRLDHPGVVQYVELLELSDGSCALHTAFVSSDTWASRPLTNAIERATAIAALAAVLADLHELGITHGNLTPAHVLHGGNDRPVICSVARSLDATPDNVAVDLTALAELMWDSQLTTGPLSDELAKLADAVRSGDRSARDVARRLDQRLAGAGEIDSGSRPRRFHRRAVLTGGAVAVSALVGVVGFAGASGSTTDHSRLTVPDETLNSSGRYAPRDISAEAALAGPASPDTEATVLIHNGRRYAAGIEGDLVLVGDWDCDDISTLAIVRPSTGEVVVFENWPAAGESISASANWHVDHTVDIEIDRSGPCDRLRVNTATGSQLIDPGAPS